MTTVEPQDNSPEDPNNWSCFGHIMSSNDYLKEHNIKYAADCKKCPYQENCISLYNERVYRPPDYDDENYYEYEHYYLRG